MKDRIYVYLRQCEHHHELQQSPRLGKLKAAFARYNTLTLVDLASEHYDAFEADMERMILEENPPAEFENPHMENLNVS